MSNNKFKHIINFISIVLLSLSFIIKLFADNIYKNLSQSANINNALMLKIITSSIIIVLIEFSFYVCIQLISENRESNLSCVHNSKFMCCLSNYSLDNLLNNNSELIDGIRLAKYERQVKTKAIWILSPDLSCEVGNNVFKEVVRSRLSEGVKYYFIALNSNISQERARTIKKQYSTLFNKNNMHFYLIDGNEYSLFLSLYSIVIYNPENPEKECAYVCVGETSENTNSVYSKLNSAHTKLAINITRDIINNTNEFIL